jgi:hypothetical protein
LQAVGNRQQAIGPTEPLSTTISSTVPGVRTPAREQYHISDGEPLTRWGLVVAQHRYLARVIETGFDGYRSIAWVLPIAWLALPILYVPGVPAVGRRAYRFVAAHRSTGNRSTAGWQDCRKGRLKGLRPSVTSIDLPFLQFCNLDFLQFHRLGP